MTRNESWSTDNKTSAVFLIQDLVIRNGTLGINSHHFKIIPKSFYLSPISGQPSGTLWNESDVMRSVRVRRRCTPESVWLTCPKVLLSELVLAGVSRSLSLSLFRSTSGAVSGTRTRTKLMTWWRLDSRLVPGNQLSWQCSSIQGSYDRAGKNISARLTKQQPGILL